MTKKKPIGKLKQAIKEGTPVALKFETARDLVLFQLQGLKQQVKKIGEESGVDLSGDISSIDDTYNFFKSTITSLKIYPNQGGEFPYSYDVNFIIRENESKEDVERLVKNYLTSETFNLILARLDPNVLNILIEYEKQKEDIKEIEKRIKELSKKEKALQKALDKKNTPKGKFKRSGHLTDQILKYSYPKDKSSQLPIFQSLKSETLKAIEVSGIEVQQVVEGIKLSPSETKLIDCLCKLLHETSQKEDPEGVDYYSGNIGHDLIEYGGYKEILAPKLAFTLYELTKEYKGGEAISGKDVDNVKQILTELDSKRFLLKYVETTKKKDGGRIERKIEDFRKLLHILKISETEYNKEDIEISKKEETVVVLNPIFRRQIERKYILYPNDINQRTIIAYGSHNLSEIVLKLRDYLIRELSSKRYTPEIGIDRLYYLLNEKWMKESRKKKVKEYTDKALETVIALGLLLSYEIKADSKGEAKIVFKLNKDWE